MKRWISLLLTALLLCTSAAALEQPTEEELSIGAPSAILIERETGTVLYEKNADERLSPASVPLRYNYDKPEKPRISMVFGYLARFFILFQTEKSSREVVIS